MVAAASQFTNRAVTEHYSNNRSGGGRPQMEYSMQEEPVTMSEPGGGYRGSVEQDRFSAYVNRFAEMDPRMDYRGGSVGSGGGSSSNMRPTAMDSGGGGGGRSRHQGGRPREEEKKEERTGMTVSERIRKLNHNRGNNFPDPEPSFEEMESAHPDDPLPVFEQLTRPSPAISGTFAMRRDANPERYGVRREVSREQSLYRDALGPGGDRSMQSEASRESMRGDESPGSEHYGQSPEYPPSPSNRTRDLARRFEQRIPSKLQMSPSIRGAHMAHQFSERGERQAVQQPRERSVSPPPSMQYRQSRLDRQEEPEMRTPSTSLPPVRRHRPLQQPAREQPVEDTHQGHDELPDLNELAARSRYDHQQRSEIETPQPARVQDLRHKLWDTNESLQVAVRPSGRESRDGQPPNQLWSHAQRASRSLSPKASRRRMEEHSVGSKMFKSRYYEAAQRSVTSPERSLPTTDQRMAAVAVAPTPYSHKVKTASDSARQIYTKFSEEEKEENLRSIKNRYKSVEGSAAKGRSEQHAASLLARLNAVNRANADDALAQIDAILRAESHSFDDGLVASERRIEIPPEKSLQAAAVTQKIKQVESAEKSSDDEESSEGSSDDDTSVSSMTNPTYQSGKLDSDQAMNPVSNAANGRPRPSSLQAYNNSSPYTKLSSANGAKAFSSRDLESKPKAKKLRSPPPATISLSASKEKSRKVVNIGVSDSIHPPSLVEASVFQKIGGFLALAGVAPAIDTANSAELAEKIRRWDDMSNNGNVPSSPDPYSQKPVNNATPKEPRRSTNPFDDDQSNEPNDRNLLGMDTRPSRQYAQEEVLSAGRGGVLSAGTGALGSIVADEVDINALAREESLRARRSHPWDSSIPVSMGKVDMKETSMDLGDGVEARFTPKYDESEEKIPDESGLGRRMRRTRLSLGIGKFKKDSSGCDERPRDETPAAVSTPPPPPTKSNLSIKETFSGDEFDVDPKLLSSQGESTGQAWEGNAEEFTSHREQDKILNTSSTSRRQENANHLSEEFDSAWVALPSSTFFADKDKISPDRTATRRNKKRDTSDIPPQISVTLDEEEDGVKSPLITDYIQKFSAETEEPARISKISNYTLPGLPSKEMRPPSAYDEGLIGDMSDDEEAEMGSIEVALVDPPLASTAVRSESRGRRGLRGLLKKRRSASSKGLPTKVSASEVGVGSRQPSFNSQALLQRALDPATGEFTAPGNRDGRSGQRRHSRASKSPSRDRARSLEERRTRNPTIAKKFSRLMRLYDDGGQNANEAGYI